MNLSKLNWPTLLFLLITPMVSVMGLYWIVKFSSFYWQTLLFALFMMVATGISITAGYHRLFSHRSYEAHPVIRCLFTLFGSAAFQGSVLEWCSDHRIHHRYVDKDKDPYSIQNGFWYAHMGWLFVQQEPQNLSNVKDLQEDPILRFQHKYFISMASVMCFLFPTLMGLLWGDPLGALILAGFVRVVVNHHFTFAINSFCHFIGKQPYSDRHSARDSWITALVTFGEGYHNFHHEFPYDYRNGIRFYQWDPTKWLIGILKFTGLAWDLKSVPEAKIAQKKLEMEKKKLLKKCKSSTQIRQLEQLWEEAQKQIGFYVEKWRKIKKELALYRQKSKVKVEKGFTKEVNSYKNKKAELKKLKKEVHNSFKEWRKSLKAIFHS
ncbi:MAG: acyl-CoA desaturase [Planctomycetota bacterium]|nr:MAG: acyl-CoA desaturase [Planctomycetota bacterium]